MTCLLRVITAVLLMLVGTGLASTEATAVPVLASGVYTYDVPSIPAAPTNSFGDRGPPRVAGSEAGETTVDRGSSGTSMSSHLAATHTETTYDHPAQRLAIPPDAAMGPTTTTGDAQAIDGALSSIQRAGVAAETAELAAGEARQVTVLGRYTGGVDAYVGKPGFNTLNLPFKGTGRWNWTRNKSFIDDAIERGDEIRLVTNPNEPLYQGGNTFQRELRYLQDRGYTWQEQGDFWNAVPR